MYDALRETVAPSLDGGGPFEITAECEDEEFGIAYRSMLSSSRYHFYIQEVEEGTQLEATLRLGGVIGPLHSFLRFWSHNRHLDKLLGGIGKRAEEIAALDRMVESGEAGESDEGEQEARELADDLAPDDSEDGPAGEPEPGG